MTDADLARQAQLAYLRALQYGEDPWVAVGRALRAWLVPLSGSAELASSITPPPTPKDPGAIPL